MRWWEILAYVTAAAGVVFFLAMAWKCKQGLDEIERTMKRRD